MAEFCLNCWNKLMGSQYSPSCFIFSREADLCEGCGEWKPVIIRFKARYLFWDRLQKNRFPRP